jgi:hypothetical protein
MDRSPDSTAGITIDGTKFPLADSVDALCMAIETGGRGALRFPIATYPSVFTLLGQWAEERYGRESQQFSQVAAASLVCAGCLGKFPDHFKIGLLMRYTRVSGAAPGFDQFSKSGICPQCGSDEALLVYEYVPPEEVSEADIYAIRRYWQERALTWWRNQSRSQAICDFCSTTIARNQGYLFSDRLICEECVQKTLANALNDLKRNPDYYGTGLLRKARPFRR